MGAACGTVESNGEPREGEGEKRETSERGEGGGRRRDSKE